MNMRLINVYTVDISNISYIQRVEDVTHTHTHFVAAVVVRTRSWKEGAT